MNQDKVKNKKLHREHGGGTELQFRNAVALVTFVIPIAIGTLVNLCGCR